MSEIRVSEIRVSEIRVSKIRGSEIRGSEIRVSEIRISSNHRELHGAIFSDARSIFLQNFIVLRKSSKTCHISTKVSSIDAYVMH